MASNSKSSKMAERTLRTHMPVMPRGFVFLRVLQLIVAIGVFGLGIWFMTNYWSLGGTCGISISTATIVILLWEIPAESCVPRAYNYWAVLTFEVILFVAYAVTFVWFVIEAWWRGSPDYRDCPSYNYYTNTRTDNTACEAKQRIETISKHLSYAGAGLCGAMWIFYLTSLIIVGSAITRHRIAGGHNYFGSQTPSQLHSVSIQTQPQPAYQHSSPIHILQMEADLTTLKQQYLHLQGQFTALQHQVEMNQTSSNSREYKTLRMEKGNGV